MTRPSLFTYWKTLAGLFLFHFMELHFVDEGGVGWDAVIALGPEGHLAGEIEAVFAAGGHHAKAFEQSGHQLGSDDVGYRLAVAVCLVEDMTVQEAALVVEDHYASNLRDSTVTLLEYFVVETLVALFDIGVFLRQLVEVYLFALLRLVDLVVLAVHAVDIGTLFQIHEHRCRLLIVERLLLAVESCADGLQKNLTVDVDACCGDVLGHRESQCPAEAVVLVFEDRCFAGVDNYGAPFVA